MRLILLLLPLILAQGCATKPPEYSIGYDGPLLIREAAQKSIQGPLQTQIKLPLDSPLEVITASLPNYPDSFRKANIEGKVKIIFVVESDGTVSNPLIVGSPPAPLAAISLNAILHWKFKPPIRNGQPVKLRLGQVFDFILENRGTQSAPVDGQPDSLTDRH